MVFRVFVEKKPALANESHALLRELAALPGVQGLTSLRIINRYDVDNIDAALFAYAKRAVFSEPQLDIVADTPTLADDERMFAVEYLPGQFDQRADSAAQCIQLISQKERPIVRTARVYVLGGSISDAVLDTVKKYVINPIESREAEPAMPETLVMDCAVPARLRCWTDSVNLMRQVLQTLPPNTVLPWMRQTLPSARNTSRVKTATRPSRRSG